MSCLETLTQYRGRHRTGRQLCLKGDRRKGRSLLRPRRREGFLAAEWSPKALSFGVRPWLGVQVFFFLL